MRAWKQGQFGVRGNSVSGTIRQGQFGVSSSLLLPLGQFGVSSSLLLPLHQVGGDNSVSVRHYCFPCIKSGDNSVSGTIRCQFADNSVSVRGGTIRGGQFGVSSSLLLPLHQVGKLDSWEDFQDRQAMTLFTTRSTAGQFGVSSSSLLPLHQVGNLDSWEDFQDRQAMTLFTTRSTAGTTEPMSSVPTANGICSLAISPAPRYGILSRSSATA